jgi:hypothetical protein
MMSRLLIVIVMVMSSSMAFAKVDGLLKTIRQELNRNFNGLQLKGYQKLDLLGY